MDEFSKTERDSDAGHSKESQIDATRKTAAKSSDLHSSSSATPEKRSLSRSPSSKPGT